MARLRKPLDWLNTSGGLLLAQSGMLTLELSQQQQLQLSSGDGDQLQPELQNGTSAFELICPVQVLVRPLPYELDQLL